MPGKTSIKDDARRSTIRKGSCKQSKLLTTGSYDTPSQLQDLASSRNHCQTTDLKEKDVKWLISRMPVSIKGIYESIHFQLNRPAKFSPRPCPKEHPLAVDCLRWRTWTTQPWWDAAFRLRPPPGRCRPRSWHSARGKDITWTTSLTNQTRSVNNE